MQNKSHEITVTMEGSIGDNRESNDGCEVVKTREIENCSSRWCGGANYVGERKRDLGL